MVASSIMFCFRPVYANFHEPPAVMQLASPANNTTYNQTSILLNATILLRQYWPANSTFEFEDMRWLNYSLDDQQAVALTLTREYNKNGPGYNEFGLCTLSNLPEGLHHIRVYGQTTANATLETTNYFTIKQVTTTLSAITVPPTEQSIPAISPTPIVPEPDLAALSPTRLWTFTMINSSWIDPPVVANGIAYVFNTEYYTKQSELDLKGLLMFGPPSHPLVTVYALNASDGSELWQYHAQGELLLFTVDKGTAYFSTTDYYCLDGKYTGAHVYALNASSGDEKWVYNVDGTISGTKHDVNNGALYVVFIASNSQVAFITAVNSSNGKEIWRYNIADYTYPRAAIGKGAMYFGADDCMYALNTNNGKILWNTTVGTAVDNVLPILSQGVLFLTSRDGKNSYALNAEDGRLLGNYSGLGYYASEKGVRGYVTEKNVAYAYDGLSGDRVWSYIANENIRSLQPSNDLVFVGSNGTLTVLSADNGKKLWDYSLPGIVYFDFGRYYSFQNYSAHLLFSRGTLFFYSGQTLRALDAYSGKTLFNYTDNNRTFLKMTDNLAFYKRANTIYALSIPDTAFSPPQNPTTIPEQSANYPELAVLEIVSAIAAVAVASVALAYFIRRKSKTALAKESKTS
jgi:outer membrane protein assembly factor BamB